MFLVGLGTRVPAQRHTQLDAWQALAASPAFAALRPRSKGLLEKVLHNRGSGIEARYFAPDPLAQVFTGNPHTLTAAFQQHAPALAIEAAHDALMDASLSAADIDGVIVSTCTRYMCPGLSGYVIEVICIGK